MLEFKSDLGDLAHVHATCALAGGVVELSVAFELRLHELLHGFQVFLVEHLPEQVEDEQGLLV